MQVELRAGPAVPRQGRFYPGWRIVLAGWVGELLSSHPLMGFTFGLFLTKAMATFGWSPIAGLAYSLYLVFACLFYPLWGAVVERVGARWCVTISVLCFATVLASFPWVFTLTGWYVGYALLGAFSGGISALPYLRTVSAWFDRRRGLAMGIVMMGGGVCTTLLPGLAHLAIAKTGWQNTYPEIALVMIIITLPVTWLFLVDKPADAGVDPAAWGETTTSSELQEQEAYVPLRRSIDVLATRDFWLMSISMALAALALFGLVPHFVPILSSWGYSSGETALMMSLLGVGSLSGRVIAGWLLDRMPSRVVAGLVFVVAGASMWVISLEHQSRVIVGIGAVLMGTVVGSENDIVGYMVSRYFPKKFFGQIYGYGYMIFTAGAATGPAVVAALSISDHAQHFTLFYLAASLLVAAIMVMGMSRAPGSPHPK
jgi:MFS family permease